MLIPTDTTKHEKDSASRDERRTLELCGEERAGRRCILARGHEGHHECPTPTATHSWK
jgi:hypothetical protein